MVLGCMILSSSWFLVSVGGRAKKYICIFKAKYSIRLYFPFKFRALVYILYIIGISSIYPFSGATSLLTPTKLLTSVILQFTMNNVKKNPCQHWQWNYWFWKQFKCSCFFWSSGHIPLGMNRTNDYILKSPTGWTIKSIRFILLFIAII